VSTPRLFVSYSWTSPDHEARVVVLATELRESGVDVILDKWDLREGHDAVAFMEKMVTDPSVGKVIMVCDSAYAAKADSRSGGVGTEAQIISPEIYANQSQDKFVAVVFERDDQGRPCVPTYYRSRIHIDLSDSSAYSENFEQLLRWVFDKPLYLKPEIGKAPEFLTQGEGALSLGTSSRQRRAVEAIRGGRDHAIAATEEYFALLASQFESLRLDPKADPFDEAVVLGIDSFIPYRNEAVEVFLSLALYMDVAEVPVVLHRFFEGLIPFLDRPQSVSTYREWDYDNYRFIIHELFLYAVAALIRYERFDAAARLMETEFYVPGRSDYGQDAMVPFHVLRKYLPSLEARKARLKLNRTSLEADMLKERCVGVGLEFRHLMQADFILFMRASLDYADSGRWWPETLVYLGHWSAPPFEVFARSKSARYFERSKVLLGLNSKADLSPLLEAWKEDKRDLPRWNFDTLNPGALLGFDALATSP